MKLGLDFRIIQRRDSFRKLQKLQEPYEYLESGSTKKPFTYLLEHLESPKYIE
jgi:hypothetical protein